MLLESPEPEQATVMCRFISHVISVLRRADCLYNSAIQAAVQLATEVQQDLYEMLRLAASPGRRKQALAVLGIDGLRLLACTPLLGVLGLDGSDCYEELWRCLAEDTSDTRHGVAGAAGSMEKAGGRLGGGWAGAGGQLTTVDELLGSCSEAMGVSASMPSVDLPTSLPDADAEDPEEPQVQAVALRCLGHALYRQRR